MRLVSLLLSRQGSSLNVDFPNHAAKAATAYHNGDYTLHGEVVLLRGSRAWDLAKGGRAKRWTTTHTPMCMTIVLEFLAFECRLANNTPWTTPRTIEIDPGLSKVCIEGVGGCGWWFGSGKGSRIRLAKEKKAPAVGLLAWLLLSPPPGYVSQVQARLRSPHSFH